jgi:hypothetical protein
VAREGSEVEIALEDGSMERGSWWNVSRLSILVFCVVSSWQFGVAV